MKFKTLAQAALLATAGLATLATSPAFAQAKEQFFPAAGLPHRRLAPNGVLWANGYVDYLKLTNARGGVNGVKISFEECETGYATDRGVECYERLEGQGRHGVPAALHRHHLRADREGPSRQDPADHRWLWPQ